MLLEALFEPMAYVTAAITRRCNLDCAYCKVEASPQNDVVMPLATAKKAARLFIENSRHRELWFNLHGGEPLLLPDDWFREVVDYARDLAAKHGKSLRFPLATNGVLVTEKRLTTLKDLGFEFCLSCDGPPEINDLTRRRGKDVVRALRLFQATNTPVGLMLVISRGNYNRMAEVMDWYRARGVRSFLANFVEAQGRGSEDQLLTPEQMLTSSLQMLEHMRATRVSVSNDDLLLKVEWFCKQQGTASRTSCAAGRRMLAVAPDGRLTVCGGADPDAFSLGSLHEASVNEHFRTVVDSFHDRGTWVIRCFDCQAKRICNFGCTTACRAAPAYQENHCSYIRLLWDALCAHPELPHAVNAVVSNTSMAYKIPLDKMAAYKISYEEASRRMASQGHTTSEGHASRNGSATPGAQSICLKR